NRFDQGNEKEWWQPPQGNCHQFNSPALYGERSIELFPTGASPTGASPMEASPTGTSTVSMASALGFAPRSCLMVCRGGSGVTVTVVHRPAPSQAVKSRLGSWPGTRQVAV